MSPSRPVLARRAVIVLLMALLPGGVGGALLWQARAERVRPRVALDGLVLQLERATWLHERRSSHEGAEAGSPGAPGAREHRLSAVLTVSNPGARARPFDVRELSLRLPSGERLSPRAATLPAPGELAASAQLAFVVQFDAPSARPVRLEWQRGGQREALLAGRSPPPLVEASWPARAQELPRGDAVAGRALFHGRLACASCHGSPEDDGAAGPLGPPLNGLARAVAARRPGVDVAQHAYESLLDPDASVPALCAGGRPCVVPSAMPAYGELLSPQEMADLVRYLLAPSGAGGER